MNTAPTTACPSLFIPHGGGPCFFMDWTWGPADTWDSLEHWLRNVAQRLEIKPKAILVISAHWEAAEFAVTAQASPPLLYDYHGFPAHTYQLTYPALGAPKLAQKVVDLLSAAGLSARLEHQRGLDHGVFIPLKLIYPQADIPVIQLSLQHGLDPAIHLAAGKAIASLRDEGVLIMGSGSSYHNMQGSGAAFSVAALRFDTWLGDAACAATAEQRTQMLTHWLQAPEARLSHPREEHLLPLMVAAGAAGHAIGQRIYREPIMEIMLSAYAFGISAVAADHCSQK